MLEKNGIGSFFSNFSTNGEYNRLHSINPDGHAVWHFITELDPGSIPMTQVILVYKVEHNHHVV